MNQKTLNQMVAYWQERLRLQDWDVRVHMIRARDMTREGRSGEMLINEQHMLAHISVLDPVDYPDDATYEQDFEDTIVHELLHVQFHGFFHTPDHADEPWKVIACEQAINRLSKALIRGADMRAWAAPPLSKQQPPVSRKSE